MSALLAQAEQMQAQLAEAQAEMAAREVTGTAGGGLVTATMSGAGDLSAVAIDPKVVDPEDIESLQDLVVAAIHDAQRQVGELAGELMGPLAGLGGDGGLDGLALPGQ